MKEDDYSSNKKCNFKFDTVVFVDKQKHQTADLFLESL